MKKVEVSPPKNLTVNDIFLNRSLRYIKNNTGLKIDLWGIPTSTGDHDSGLRLNLGHAILSCILRCPWKISITRAVCS